MTLLRCVIVGVALVLVACQEQDPKPNREAIYGKDYMLLDNGMVVTNVQEMNENNAIAMANTEK